MTFSDFAAASAQRPWAWGIQDCTIWVADWCVARWGVDPAEKFRGAYSTEAEAVCLIRSAGGLIDLVAPHLGFLTEKPTPSDGDIGIIDILGRQTASIFDGGKWAFSTRAGIGFVQCKPLIVWGD